MMMTRVVLTLLLGLTVSLCFSERSWAPISVGPIEDEKTQTAFSILPDVSPEDQYRFALGKALERDLETAESAFSEFLELNRGHDRSADATYWLGRVQFLQERYEKAAMTLSEFNKTFPADARIENTASWIAESVSHFASPEQACDVYTKLPGLFGLPPKFDPPPSKLLSILKRLVSETNCDVRGAGSSAKIASSRVSQTDNKVLCLRATELQSYKIGGVQLTKKGWSKVADLQRYVQEAKSLGLSCGVAEVDKTDGLSGVMRNLAIAKAVVEDVEKKQREKERKVDDVSGLKATSAALTAAEKEAQRLRQRVAALEAEKAKQQQTISSDTKLPTVTIASAYTKGKQGMIRGKAKDNTGIAEVSVDGRPVPFDASGNFKFETFVPTDGKQVTIQVTDLNGLSNSKTVKLNRSTSNTSTAITFESLNPLGRKVAKNKDALALIIGVDGYENTSARAIYADSDAKVFADYASEKLGIPSNRIKTLVNDGAGEREMLLSVKSWLARASKRDKTDVYIFFAGHGLASDDGQKMYLLPYDGAPELLDDTAILRDRLFSDIASANPRSVTVFLDTCYSGTTRGTDMLIASRPIAIRALEQSIPDNFTVMTAAAGDQTAKPLEEAKHGMFSYFLMKGMEGEADSNQDNKITAGELHSYVQSNVVQQSSGSQTPELQGDENRVLVQFQ